jgi:hypothetical protein
MGDARWCPMNGVWASAGETVLTKTASVKLFRISALHEKNGVSLWVTLRRENPEFNQKLMAVDQK